MPSNLSVKNVPEPVLAALRARAARNRRSLQGELMCILEAAVLAPEHAAPQTAAQAAHPARQATTTEAMDRISIDTLAARAKQLFPAGTPSSVDFVRAMRDGRNS